MKKFLLILGGVILSLSASAGEGIVKKLHVVAEVHPIGAGTVYLHAKCKGGNAEAERQYVYDRTGGRGDASTNWNADQGWEEKAELWYVPGENGSMKDVDCTHTNPIYEAVMKARPADGWELVCYANKIKEDGIYYPEDCYALIHGDSGDPRNCDFDYRGEEWHADNTGEHWINANNNITEHPEKDGSNQKDVFNTITSRDDFPCVDSHVYAIFRRVGESLPTFSNEAVYFVNMGGWDDIKAYAWNDTPGGNEMISSDWPGDAVNSAGVTNIYDQDFDTYKATFGKSPQFILFNDGQDDAKTGDMTYFSEAHYAYDGLTETSKMLFLDGEKMFQFDKESSIQGMSMCYPRYFVEGEKTTICLPFPLTAEQARTAGKFYKIISYTNGQLVFDEYVGEIAANTPYVFEAATAYPFEDIYTESVPKTELQELVAEDGSKLFSALKKDLINTIGQHEGEVLFSLDEETGEWKSHFGFGISYVNAQPYYAYVGVPSSAVPEGLEDGSVIPASYDGQSTAIKYVENAEGEGNDAVYDLSGRRVSPTAKGVVITKGKKIVIK